MCYKIYRTSFDKKKEMGAKKKSLCEEYRIFCFMNEWYIQRQALQGNSQK